MDEKSEQPGRQVVYVAVDAYELERGYFEPSSLVRADRRPSEQPSPAAVA